MQRRHQKIIEEAPAPRDQPARARAHRRALRRGVPQDRLRGRGHVRVPVRERRVLFHRDEHAHAGRAPGDRDDHRHRHRADADPHRGRREAAVQAARRRSCAGTRSNAASTPRTRTRFTPRPGASPPSTCRAGRASASTRTPTTATSCRRNYDSLIGKIIAYGDTREQAIARMRVALSEMIVEGIKTNLPLHQELMRTPRFCAAAPASTISKRSSRTTCATNSAARSFAELAATRAVCPTRP